MRLTSPAVFRPIFRLWAVLLLVVLGVAIYYGWHRLGLPYALDYGEGPVLWQAANVLNPRRTYASLDSGPLVIWNYPPAYLLVSRAIAALQGDLLWSGRFVSFLSCLGVTVLLASIAWRALPARLGSRTRICAAATGALFLGTPSAVAWFSLMRADLLGLLAVYLGIFFFISSRSRPWKGYLAFLFFSLALFTKQTLIAAPLACLLVALLLAPARAFLLALMTSGLGVIALWFGMRWTHGTLLRHLVAYNVHPFSVFHAFAGVWQALIDMRLLLFLLGVLIVFSLLRALRPRPIRSFKVRLRRSPYVFTLAVESLHFLFALAFSLSYGKVGSNVNYFLEWNASLCILASLCLGLLLWHALRSPQVTLTVAAVYLLPVVLAVSALDAPLQAVATRSTRQSQRVLAQAYEQLLPLLAAQPGPVLSDDMVLLVHAGKDIVFEPATMQFVADAGTWDQAAFLRRLDAREFAVIVIGTPIQWHPRVLAAIQQNYLPDRVVGAFQLYRPRSF